MPELVPGKSSWPEERVKDMFDKFKCAPTGFMSELVYGLLNMFLTVSHSLSLLTDDLPFLLKVFLFPLHCASPQALYFCVDRLNPVIYFSKMTY